LQAIEKLAMTEGLYVSQVYERPSSDISVFFYVPGADNWTENCVFNGAMVADWVDNNKVEGRRHVAAQIDAAKKKMCEHYENSR
jgi:hypothetical protein